jgi:hypothetical protein
MTDTKIITMIDKLLIIVVWFWATTTMAAQTEAQYITWLNDTGFNGQTEQKIQGGRADIVTDIYAIEVEWAHKWKESIGQAMWYGMQTNKKPGIVLLMRSIDDRKYGIMLESALRHAGIYNQFQVWFYPEDFGYNFSNAPSDQIKSIGLHPESHACDYWLNTNSNVRHNRSCSSNFGLTRNGRCAGSNEGKACGKCGG